MIHYSKNLIEYIDSKQIFYDSYSNYQLLSLTFNDPVKDINIILNLKHLIDKEPKRIFYKSSIYTSIYEYDLINENFFHWSIRYFPNEIPIETEYSKFRIYKKLSNYKTEEFESIIENIDLNLKLILMLQQQV